PRDITWDGQSARSGIVKEPVQGPVMLRQFNLDGDGQADLSVHGGSTKAVYGYPEEHYSYWRERLPENELPFGVFGENFTTEGLDEETVCIGDQFGIGRARIVVTEPRLPCSKLAMRFRRHDMQKLFLRSGRTGFYFSVLEEGEVETGNEITLLGREGHGLKVGDITRLYSTEQENEALLAVAISVATLPEKWRMRFQLQLERLQR
ncbi:MAG: MOSC domain-containing protein, partial [Rhodothermia bacterium]